MWQRIRLFFEESRQEFRRVNWPTFQETRQLTIVVVAFSLMIALFLGILDFIFTGILTRVIL